MRLSFRQASALGVFLLVLVWALPVSAAKLAQPAKLSSDDQAQIAKVESYLNAVGTLKARFLQTAPDGSAAEGDLYLSRPGRMRIAYDPPTPILILADGKLLIYHDTQLQQVSYVPLDSTPAGILVRPSVSLSGKDITVTRFRRGEGLLAVSLQQTQDPAAGEITLIFTEQPFQLKQWRVIDPQGQITTISLFDARMGIALDPKLFEFKNPNFTKPQLPN